MYVVHTYVRIFSHPDLYVSNLCVLHTIVIQSALMNTLPKSKWVLYIVGKPWGKTHLLESTYFISLVLPIRFNLQQILMIYVCSLTYSTSTYLERTLNLCFLSEFLLTYLLSHIRTIILEINAVFYKCEHCK